MKRKKNNSNKLSELFCRIIVHQFTNLLYAIQVQNLRPTDKTIIMSLHATMISHLLMNHPISQRLFPNYKLNHIQM